MAVESLPLQPQGPLKSALNLLRKVGSIARYRRAYQQMGPTLMLLSDQVEHEPTRVLRHLFANPNLVPGIFVAMANSQIEIPTFTIGDDGRFMTYERLSYGQPVFLFDQAPHPNLIEALLLTRPELKEQQANSFRLGYPYEQGTGSIYDAMLCYNSGTIPEVIPTRAGQQILVAGVSDDILSTAIRNLNGRHADSIEKVLDGQLSLQYD